MFTDTLRIIIGIIGNTEKLTMLRGHHQTPGEVFSTEPAILKMAVVVDKDAVVIGFRMWVFNFEYLLVLAHLPPTIPPMLDHAHYRPAGLVVEGSAKKIRFEWGQPSGSEEVRVTWVGHK